MSTIASNAITSELSVDCPSVDWDSPEGQVVIAKLREHYSLCACGASKSRSYDRCPDCWRQHKATRRVRRSYAERSIDGKRLQYLTELNFGSVSDLDPAREDDRGTLERAGASEHSGKLELRNLASAPVEENFARSAHAGRRRASALALDATLAGKRVIFSTKQAPKSKAQRVPLDARSYGVCFDSSLHALQAEESMHAQLANASAATARELASFSRATGAPYGAEIKMMWADVGSHTQRARAVRARIYDEEQALERAARAFDSYRKEIIIEHVNELDACDEDESPDGPASWRLRMDILSMYGEARYQETFGEPAPEWLVEPLRKKRPENRLDVPPAIIPQRSRSSRR